MEKNVSILIPAYNEEELIEKTTLDLYDYLQNIKSKSIISSFEIIICINGSTDNTEKLALNLSKQHKEIDYFSIKEKGMGIALTEGIKKSKKNIITLIAADGEDLLDFIEEVVPLMDEYQFINCSKYLVKQRLGSNLIRDFLSRSFREFFRLMFKYKFTDTTGAWVFRRDIVKLLVPHMKKHGFNWSLDVLYYVLKYNLKTKEVPLKIRFRRSSRASKVDLLSVSWGFFTSALKYGFKIYFENDTRR